jgi:hypothetical protein
MMRDFLSSGRVVDIAILVTVAEAAALVAYRWATGRGLALSDVAAMLGAGLCLMLALRAALTGAAAGWIAAFLVAALLAHLADLRRRWPVVP